MISTKGRYALRLMLDLAIYDTGEPVRIRDIAARQEISEKYLEQIISMLNKAGFVQSIRGAQGGYLLKKEPSEYTAGEILRLTEGDLSLVDCVGEENGSCRRKPECATARIWERISEAVNQVVDGITLDDMVKWHLQMTSGQGREENIGQDLNFRGDEPEEARDRF